MTALLTDNLPQLSGAPNGIQKLRELILELAVRGKLVPQDPNDEPASELLEHIAEERRRLATEGTTKKKPPEHTAEAEAPFDLPKSWQWARLGDLSELITSGSRDWAQYYSDEGAIFVRMGNLSRRSYELRLSSIQRVSPPKGGEGSRTKLEPGDLLLSITGEVGLLGLIPDSFGEAYINQHVCLIRFVCSLRSRFLPEALRSPLAYKQYEAPQRGIKNSFRLSDVSEILVPLPPLSEQHRIVAKIDELMALCGRLEAQQADAESAQTQLVQALLDSLTQANDANDFTFNWQRLAEHFHSLFTTEPSIDALKQTLLQLAVMGKLVSQNPIDKTGTELLERIQNSRVDKRKIVTLDEKTTIVERLPESWIWSSIDQLSADDSRAITDGPFGANLKTEHYIDTPGYRVIRLQNIGNGMFRDEHRAYINQERFEKIIKHQVSSGDLVIAGLIDTSIRSCYVPADIGPAVVKADCYRFSVHPLVSSKYVLYYLNSKMAHEFAAAHHHGLTLTRIGLGNFRSIPVPLPPAAEQHRIAAKVDQLMALCDQLKTCLNQARQINEQLASTLVECALAEDSPQGPIATDRQVSRTLLAAEITHQLHSQRTFGQRKLQKVIYLAEHAARLAAIQGNYLRDAAGPHDRQLMNQIEGELQNRKWYERIERENVGHAYRPLSQSGQHRQAYSSTWSAAERTTIEQVIELMRDWDTDRCEMTVTLYAAWNDFILEGRPVSDEAIVDEVIHRWNDTKLRFGKPEWLAILAEMKKQKILMPTGFGKRTTGGMLSLPGFE
ncbi:MULTISPECIES: restriction endonuclease subunit S [Pseudomonas]|uniref:Type I restriction modification DNA specificity domain-containing protein n=2 Tax=Pseudomonas TaxID=286 RepID=A0A3M3ERD1_9PSED|nr:MULTISPECIES: restriction endonuclease subunit S [Pseudomonas]KPW89451.1 hypothetical protein ALO79_200002 [Pseudomonas syringae pv. castaneae]RMM52165.1 hypothetical protein ALQ77_04280 [Pseudomonas corrugata]SDV05591.1 type I restriction enzyme, S subunit [Pseudomonas corrugata]